MPSGARDEGDHLLAGLCDLWVAKIKKAEEAKKAAFQDDADEAMTFYKPPKDGFNFVYRGDLAASRGVGFDIPEPSMKMTLAKVAEVVQIFGPLLYSKNPNRQVNPRPPAELPPSAVPDPMLHQMLLMREQARIEKDGLKSSLLAAYLNWTPNEMRLTEHSKAAIDEAIIKGRGCLWTEQATTPGARAKVVGSFFDSVDFLQIDPDAESLESAWWVARRCCHPTWDVERTYGLEVGSLKDRGTHESAGMQAEVDSGGRQIDRARGHTNDLLVYYKVYSRMGCGGRLSGTDRNAERTGLLPGDLAGFAATLDPITGDHVMLVIAPGIGYPLNLPPAVQKLPMTGDGSPSDGFAEVRRRLAWPVPYWEDKAWPVSVLDFHAVPRSVWPMSHIKPAMGELRFLCWAYSFVAGKIKNTLRDVIAILKEMAEEFKLTVLEGADLSMVALDTNNRDIKECVQVLQFPQMNADIWRIIEAVEANFDKRVGLNEVFYGKTLTQDRSATESQLKSASMNIRPDDMAARVEEWMTEVARKEGIAARWLLEPKDVLPVLGVTRAALWGLHVKSSDLTVFRELEYRIESGSTKKPNRERDVANADSAMQILLPVFNQFAMGTGQLGPLNALIAMFAKTRDMDPGPLMLPEPPPLPPPGPPPEGGPDGATENVASSDEGGEGGPPA